MCARDPALFGQPLSAVSELSGALKQSMERKTLWFWLCSAGYLWRGSIHPFVLCGYGRCGWEFWEAEDRNEATTPPPPPNSHKHVGGRWGQLVPPAFEIQCSRVHTHTLIYTQKHTQKTNSIIRGIPDLCLHLRSDYSPFCCETNDSLLSDLLSASSSYRTVHTNLSSFLLYL